MFSFYFYQIFFPTKLDDLDKCIIPVEMVGIVDPVLEATVPLALEPLAASVLVNAEAEEATKGTVLVEDPGLREAL